MSLSVSAPLDDCVIVLLPVIFPPYAGVKYLLSISLVLLLLPIILVIAVYPPDVIASVFNVYTGKSSASLNSFITDGGTTFTGKHTSWLCVQQSSA